MLLLAVAALLPLRGNADGEQLYAKHCAACHGAEGDGGVGVPLNLPDFLAVASDDYLKKTIRQGRPGRVMPGFPRLSDSELASLVSYLRSLADVPAPDYSDKPLAGNAARGEQLFAQHCVSCHGSQGEGGVGTGVTFSRPREAPVMAPALNNPGFQQAASDEMLKSTLLRGRKGTPMPSLTSLGLSESDADDLVAYLRTLNTGEASAESDDHEIIIQYESSYDLEQTLENLKEAVVGRNFRVIRLQHLEEGLAKPGTENPRAVMLYFCNFALLNDALAIDARVGLFLPCRVTVVDTGHGVQVSSINPKSLSRLFNNSELDRACQEMHDLYEEIIEEATL
jgi:cytochrome c oxidase cbb3-type subunit 3